MKMQNLKKILYFTLIIICITKKKLFVIKVLQSVKDYTLKIFLLLLIILQHSFKKKKILTIKTCFKNISSCEVLYL